jgi:hypothetical protein
MSNLLSVLALALAFAAIWFAAAMQWRIERLSQDTLKAHVKAVQEATRMSDAALSELRRRLDAVERDVKGFTSARREDAEMLVQLARRTQELRNVVSAAKPAAAERPALPAQQTGTKSSAA